MKMRVVSLLLVLVMLVLVLTSCSTDSADAGAKNPFDGRFAEYRVDMFLTVLVDKGTGVCYLWYRWGDGAGMSVMLDEEGRPLTYWEDGYAE